MLLRCYPSSTCRSAPCLVNYQGPGRNRPRAVTSIRYWAGSTWCRCAAPWPTPSAVMISITAAARKGFIRMTVRQRCEMRSNMTYISKPGDSCWILPLFGFFCANSRLACGPAAAGPLMDHRGRAAAVRDASYARTLARRLSDMGLISVECTQAAKRFCSFGRITGGAMNAGDTGSTMQRLRMASMSCFVAASMCQLRYH